ncbi:MAG TPA: hypothetical protein VH643_03325 [Gemmataceae bacterium]|jgi:hypothetical protein
MSSALAMILTAAMAVPGNGSEKTSGETTDNLRFTGRWEGTLTLCWQDNNENYIAAVLSDGVLTLHRRYDGDPYSSSCVFSSCVFTDTGKGTVRLRLGKSVYEGIYRIEREDILLCFKTTGKRPSSFKVRAGTMLFTLRREKIRPKKNEPREKEGELIKVLPKGEPIKVRPKEKVPR